VLVQAEINQYQLNDDVFFLQGHFIDVYEGRRCDDQCQ
jgi:hypothetical protein